MKDTPKISKTNFRSSSRKGRDSGENNAIKMVNMIDREEKAGSAKGIYELDPAK